MTAHIYRVRFTECQVFAKDIVAEGPEQAIELARALRATRGSIQFKQLDGGTHAWEAEFDPDPCPAEILADVRDAYLSGRTDDLDGILAGDVCARATEKAKGGDR